MKKLLCKGIFAAAFALLVLSGAERALNGNGLRSGETGSYKVNSDLVAIAHDEDITFRFSGTVSYVDPLLNSIAIAGTRITGSYTFDPNVPDTDPSDPTVGLYSSPTRSKVSVGTFTVHATPVTFNIFDNLVLGQSYRTQYRTVLSQTNAVVNGLTYNGFSLDLWSTSTAPLSIFSSDALPIAPPSISAFDNNQLTFYFLDLNGAVHYIIGDLTSLTSQ